jgi:hypothetical protein
MATTPAQAQGLDPTQQKAMQIMVKQAMSLLLKDETAKHIVAKAQSADPKHTVLEAVVPLLTQIYQMAQVAGAKVEMVTLLAAGIQVIAVMAKMLEAAGVITEQEVPAFCADVAKMAVDQHNLGVSKQAPTAPQGQQPQQSPGGGMMGAAPQLQGA